jgi:hypothetical protein
MVIMAVSMSVFVYCFTDLLTTYCTVGKRDLKYVGRLMAGGQKGPAFYCYILSSFYIQSIDTVNNVNHKLLGGWKSGLNTLSITVMLNPFTYFESYKMFSFGRNYLRNVAGHKYK